MQNRYVGDVGDYGKYALLRGICGREGDEIALRLGIIWCLYPDEGHNSDGRHVSYLKNRNLRFLDPELHDVLNSIVDGGHRNISLISESPLFPSDTVFFERPISESGLGSAGGPPSDRLSFRSAWIRSALETTGQCDLLFFDPDNGLNIPSVSKKHRKAGKYIFLDELHEFASRDHSLVVYHHLNRTSTVEEQVKKLRNTLETEFSSCNDVIPLIFRRGSCRVFWLLLVEAHAPSIKVRTRKFLDAGWNRHFDCESLLLR